MSKIWVITLLGFFIAVVPFLGFPGSLRTALIVLAGLAVAGISFRMFISTRYSSQAFLSVFKENQKVGGEIVPPPGA